MFFHIFRCFLAERFVSREFFKYVLECYKLNEIYNAVRYNNSKTRRTSNLTKHFVVAFRLRFLLFSPFKFSAGYENATFRSLYYAILLVCSISRLFCRSLNFKKITLKAIECDGI